MRACTAHKTRRLRLAETATLSDLLAENYCRLNRSPSRGSSATQCDESGEIKDQGSSSGIFVVRQFATLQNSWIMELLFKDWALFEVIPRQWRTQTYILVVSRGRD
jgi:hypothetical protein